MMKICAACLIVLHLAMAHAELDEHQRKGLEDTQDVLKSPGKREEFIKTDKRAKQVDDNVSNLAGDAGSKEEIYGIAAKVMEKVTAEANGDPEKMQRLLLEAQTNPQLFYEKYFDAGQKAAVKSVAGKIEKKKSNTAPAPR